MISLRRVLLEQVQRSLNDVTLNLVVFFLLHQLSLGETNNEVTIRIRETTMAFAPSEDLNKYRADSPHDPVATT